MNVRLNDVKHIEPAYLEYRRQFLLSSRPVPGFSQWQKATIGSEYSLITHPDLELTQTKINEHELTLIGYIIDPFHPERNNSEILSDLLRNSTGEQSLFHKTEHFSGRWVLISRRDNKMILFNDPGGLRSVFYTDANHKEFFCSSQAGLISELLGIPTDEAAERDFINSEYFKNAKEYWWPGGTSLYQGVKHLLPNHCLDLKKVETKRFWPQEGISPMDLDECVSKSSDLLAGLMRGAAARFEIAFAITGGFDTRVLLAASRDICDDIYFYTSIYGNLDRNSPDIRIPNRLLTSLGLKHHILDCRSEMDAGFKKLYMNNVAFAHHSWGDIASGLNECYPKERVYVNGNCSGVAKCNYYKSTYPRKITGAVLSRLAGMGENKFTTAGFETWLKNTRGVAHDCNIDILDLLYWEHRMGVWQAMSQLEWDIIMEKYTPFNCRQLLKNLVSVDKKYRMPPRHKLFELIIQNLWEEVLNEPINPKLFKYTLRPLVKKILHKTGTYNIVSSILNR